MIQLKQKYLVAITLFLFFPITHALQVHDKLWLSTKMTRPIKQDSKFRYYLEPELRFIDDKYKFSQAILWTGLGYQPNPTLVFYLGYAFDTSRSTSGVYNHTNILWQQVEKKLLKTTYYELSNRIKMEDSKRNHESGWAMVLRERLQLKVPIEKLPTYSIVVSEEPFFSLRHPDWTHSHNFVSQNRAFVGLQKAINKTTNFQFGYLNQYIWSDKREMNNVITVALDISN